MSRSYMHILGSASPSFGAAARAGDIVAALAPPPSAPGALATKPAPSKSSVKDLAIGALPGLAGAGVGALIFRKKHWVLGALAGHALVSTAHPLLTGKDRKRALCQLGVEGAGIAGALYWKAHPFAGWALGIAAGLVATSFVEGSATNELYHKWRNG